MTTDYQKIMEIARASLMPDFFAVRIEEEGLFDRLRQLLVKIRLPQPLPQMGTIQSIAQASSDPNAFIEAIKAQNLWTTLRDILARLPTK